MSAIKNMQNMLMTEQPEATGALALFERFARDASVDVDKLERLVQMHERAGARFSEEQFNAAMSTAQQAMRPIATDADNPQTRSRYASYSALDQALRPIYTQHGFGLSFDTGDAPHDLEVRVLCYVSHGGGHSRTYHLDMPADGKGAKGGDVMTRTHATGAAISYGMRYLLKMIFNVAVGESDDDGNGATAQASAPQPPKDYDNTITDLQAAADEGQKAFGAACKALAPGVLEYALKHDKAKMQGLKAIAQGVDRKGAH